MKRVIQGVLIIFLLSGCSQPASNVNNSKNSLPNIGPSDVHGVSVSAIASPHFKRLVALANGSAEIIAAMGMESSVVGRDVASTMPLLASIPIVTSGHQVIPEKIISLNPDLVLIDASTGPASAIKVLKNSQISLKEIGEAWTLADIQRKVSDIGVAIGATSSANALNKKISIELAKLRISSSAHPRIAFLYLRGTSAIYLMGGPGSGADSLIGAIGAIDVGAETLKHPFNSLTSEALVTAQPDVLLVMTKGLESVGGVDGLISLPGVAQTPAGKHRRIIAVDDSLLLSFGPRTPALLALLAKDVSEVMKR
jgi:iron complex transport system substrate-binding protein